MEASVGNRQQKVQYELIRSSRRKTIALKVNDEGQVVVSAPLKAPIAVIEEFVYSKHQWIQKQLHRVHVLPQPLKEHTYKEGDRFLVLGKEIVLRLYKDASLKQQVFLKGNELHLYLAPQAKEVSIKKAIWQWYGEYGLSLYKPLVDSWAKRLGIKKPYEVRMAAFPKRMGSCSSNRVITFALRSVMLPPSLIDYLALHEVAHLLHFNHGTEFKKLLDAHMSDWQHRKAQMSTLRLLTSRL